MKKKIAVLIAAMVCFLFIISACSPVNNTNSTTSNNAGNTSTPSESVTEIVPGKLPIVDTKVELSVFAQSTQYDITKNWAENYLEELTNIHVNWMQVPTEQFKEKMNLLLASGEQVDVIMIPNMTVAKPAYSEVYKLANQDLIIPLNDLVEQYAVNYKKTLERFPELKKAITAPDGNMYGFGQMSTTFHARNYNKLWFNKQWCDNLGLEIPTTPDELYQVLKAFKENDPNQNNQQDEIPLTTIAKSNGHTKLDAYLMNAFVYCDPHPTSGRLYVDNDQVVASFTKDEYREGLRFIRKLYADGLIYPESFTQDQKTQQALNDGSDVSRIGAAPGPHAGYVSNYGSSDRWQEYIALPPLTGPSGKPESVNHQYTLMEQGAFITKYCKTPEIATMWIDQFVSDDEIGFNLYMGQKGNAWDWAVEGELGSDGKPALFKELVLEEDDPYMVQYKGNMGLRDITCFTIARSYHSQNVSLNDIFAPNSQGIGRYFHIQSEPYEAVTAPIEKALPNLYYEESVISEYSHLKLAIDDYVEQSLARFTTGNMDVENDWDKFQTELQSIGLDRYLQIVQEAYDNWNK